MKASLVPTHLTLDFSQGSFKVQYAVHLETDSFKGAIAGGETPLEASKEILEAAEALKTRVETFLNSRVGLANTPPTEVETRQLLEDEGVELE